MLLAAARVRSLVVHECPKSGGKEQCPSSAGHVTTSLQRAQGKDSDGGCPIFAFERHIRHPKHPLLPPLGNKADQINGNTTPASSQGSADINRRIQINAQAPCPEQWQERESTLGSRAAKAAPSRGQLSPPCTALCLFAAVCNARSPLPAPSPRSEGCERSRAAAARQDASLQA